MQPAKHCRRKGKDCLVDGGNQRNPCRHRPAGIRAGRSGRQRREIADTEPEQHAARRQGHAPVAEGQRQRARRLHQKIDRARQPAIALAEQPSQQAASSDGRESDQADCRRREPGAETDVAFYPTAAAAEAAGFRPCLRYRP